MDGENNTSDLRVASFSCYLNTAEENLVCKLGRAIQDTSPKETPSPISFGRITDNEGEISIFGADKYFSMKPDDENRTNYEHKKEGLKPNFKLGTPTVNSEANSCNSQTALLQSLQRNPSQIKQRKAPGNRCFPSFGCKGRSDKKSVYIDKSVEHGVLHGIKQSQPGLKRGEQFSFPIFNSGMETFTVKKVMKEEKVEAPRESLEVFGSYMTKKGDIAMNLERKLSILSWDAIPKGPGLLKTPFGSSTICDDMASDASSDLFEIENISGTGYPLLTRQASDNMSICMSPTTQYAPSEASIEWSVVTASAADFSLLVSDYDEKNITVAGNTISKAATTKNLVGREAPKILPSRLLGCGTQKAVRVAESAHSTSEKAKHQGSDSSISFGKSQTETNHSFASRGLSP